MDGDRCNNEECTTVIMGMSVFYVLAGRIVLHSHVRATALPTQGTGPSKTGLSRFVIYPQVFPSNKILVKPDLALTVSHGWNHFFVLFRTIDTYVSYIISSIVYRALIRCV